MNMMIIMMRPMTVTMTHAGDDDHGDDDDHDEDDDDDGDSDDDDDVQRMADTMKMMMSVVSGTWCCPAGQPPTTSHQLHRKLRRAAVA
eukprot:11821134-Karenia_brevis.AAC.1